MGPLILLALAILVPPFQGAYGQQETFCSPGPRAANLNRCLAAIRVRALDKVNSAYGEAYFDRCPPEERFSANCFEPDRITEPKSLAELTLRVDEPDLSTIDRFLHIRYTSPSGSYTGCDHTYTYPNEKSFPIDPLSDRAYPSWDLREYPNATWDYTDGEFFTLMVVYPNWATVAVIANIRGNDFTNAIILYPYDGIRNSHNEPKPYSFILYKQTRQLFIERVPSSGLNVTAFAERNQLQGPVAFSWVNALYDAYSVGRYRFSENCASLVQDALQTAPPREDNLPNELDLKVFLRVRHTTNPGPYECGPYSIQPPPMDFFLDPIDPSSFAVNTADIRAGSLTTMTMIMNKVNPRPSDFDGKLHTIMFISSQIRNLLGIIVNVEGDNFTSRSTQLSSGFNPLPYRTPLVVENGADHYLSIQAYEQAARIPTTLDMTPYISCSEVRIFTNMDGFISDHQLTLVGVSRMMLSDDDEYSRCRLW